MILNLRKWLDIDQTQYEQSDERVQDEVRDEVRDELPVWAAGSHCEKSFFEIFQSQLKGFIRIPDFTNFPANTGFLVMENKELPVE
jgi:hypothetical protein